MQYTYLKHRTAVFFRCLRRGKAGDIIFFTNFETALSTLTLLASIADFFPGVNFFYVYKKKDDCMQSAIRRTDCSIEFRFSCNPTSNWVGAAGGVRVA